MVSSHRGASLPCCRYRLSKHSFEPTLCRLFMFIDMFQFQNSVHTSTNVLQWQMQVIYSRLCEPFEVPSPDRRSFSCMFLLFAQMVARCLAWPQDHLTGVAVLNPLHCHFGRSRSRTRTEPARPGTPSARIDASSMHGLKSMQNN